MAEEKEHKVTVTLTFRTNAEHDAVVQGVAASLQEFADSNELFGHCYLGNNEYDDLWLADFAIHEE